MQDEDDASHLGMDRAKDIDTARIFELHLFYFRIFVKPKIERVGFGHREDVVKYVILVRPFNSRASEHREKMRAKNGIPLRDDLDCFRCGDGQVGDRLVNINDEIGQLGVIDLFDELEFSGVVFAPSRRVGSF